MTEPSSWRGARLVPRATPYVVHRIGSGPSPQVVRARWTAAGVVGLLAGLVAAVAVAAGAGSAATTGDPGDSGGAATARVAGVDAVAAAPVPAPASASTGRPVAADANGPPGGATGASTSDAEEPVSASATPGATVPVTARALGATPASREANDFVATLPADRLQLWEQIAHCESRGDWSIATGNGYYGGLQFSLTSWHGVGGVGRPDGAAWAEQVMRAEMLVALQGWEAWPECARALGLVE
jgi:hypothetical protein